MEEVFAKRDKKAKPGFNVATMLGTKPKALTQGEIGLEIEVEGNKFPKPEGHENAHTPYEMPGMKFWSYVKDGSLRGKDNAEYVLTKPVKFSEVPAAINELFSGLKEFGSKLDESNRTSVHVHLNCQNFFLNRLTSFMSLYVIFEEVLTEWCGDHRVGNLFTLRSTDAPAIVTMLKKFVMHDGIFPIPDGYHYSGMNAQALHKYGSLEFRSMRGCTDPETILEWVSILQRLYDVSEAYSDPRELIGQFSGEGPMGFFDAMLGDRGPVIRAGIEYNDEMIIDSMFRGVRLAQDLCFCRDWSLFKEVRMKPDPFGRDGLKQARRVANGLTPSQIAEAAAMLEHLEQPTIGQQINLATYGAGLASATAHPPVTIYDGPEEYNDTQF